MSKLIEMRTRVHEEAKRLRAELELDGADAFELSRMDLSNRRASSIAKAVLDRMDGVRTDRGWEHNRLNHADPTPQAAIRNILRSEAHR